MEVGEQLTSVDDSSLLLQVPEAAPTNQKRNVRRKPPRDWLHEREVDAPTPAPPARRRVGMLSREANFFEQAFKDMMVSLPPEATNLIGKRPHMEDDLEFLPLQAADVLAAYVRQKIAAEARGETFQNVVWEALAEGPPNLDAALTTEALRDLRRRIEAKHKIKSG